MKKTDIRDYTIIAIAGAFAFLFSIGSAFADVSRVNNEDGTFKIVVHNSIEHDQDAAELQKLVDTNGWNGWVQLSSNGGSVSEGWDMAMIIRKAEGKTFVNELYTCMSACTYVYMGGVERYIQETAEFNLGYHPAWVSEFDGDTSFNKAYQWGQQDALDTAMRFSYFVEEGYEWGMIKFLTTAYDNSDKDNFYYASTQELVDAGIVTHTY